MGRFFSSIYLKLIVVGLLAVIPAGYLILYNDQARISRLLDQQLQEQFRLISHQMASTLTMPQDMVERFDPESRRCVSSFNSVSKTAQIVQAALYKKGDRPDDFQLDQNIQLNKAFSVPLLATATYRPDEFSAIRRIDDMRYTFVMPIGPTRSTDYLLFIQAVDETRPGYIHATIFRQGLFLSITFMAILLFVGFIIHSEIKIPIRHLKRAFSSKRKTALDPDDFGEFGDLVRVLEDYRSSREDTGDEQFIDAATGLPTEAAAQKIYADARAVRDEKYVVIFKSNFAKEYIKSFGRANRDIIKKITAESLAKGIPANAPRALTEDFYFITAIYPKEFKLVFDRATRAFGENILGLYELGQGRQVPIQTLSALAVSNQAPGMETYAKALDIVGEHWDAAVDPQRGGWAILNADGLFERSSGNPLVPGKPKATPMAAPTPPAAKPVAAPKPTAAPKPAGGTPPIGGGAIDGMEPSLARKMFIVKLARLAGVKPRLAAQVFSAGWHKPDLLLQTRIQDLSTKAGMETQEAADLIANLRKLPREKLDYGQDDYREVFITDVRMVRKIGRESITRWFDAGFRRMEQLVGVSVDELTKLDETVSKEDIEAVLATARGTAARS